MTAKPDEKIDPIRPTNAQAIRLAKTLMRTSRFGALAVLEPDSGHPMASRVAVATAADGAPVILVSKLSGHTQGLEADPRCTILLGEPGKGDPLAHPRMTLLANARFLPRGELEREFAAARYLRRNPKASLYADFGDFTFARLEPLKANLNGGFGQAFRLAREELLDNETSADAIAKIEVSAIEHMSKEHPSAVQAIGASTSNDISRKWRLTGIDSTGADFVSNEFSTRAWFDEPVQTADQLRLALSALAKR